MVKLEIIEEESNEKQFINFKSEGTFYELAKQIKNSTNFTIPKYFYLITDGDKLKTQGKIKFYENQKIKIRDVESLEGFAINFNDITCGNILYIPVSSEVPERKEVSNGMDLIPQLSEVPKWREVCNGINLFGRCEIENCVAYDKEIVAKIDDDNYDLCKNNGQMNCPMCNSKCESKTVGFYNCYYNYYGVKYDENKDKTEKFGVEIPNLSKSVINNNDTVIVNGKAIKINKTEFGNASYFSPDNGVVQFIKLVFQVKKYFE